MRTSALAFALFLFGVAPVRARAQEVPQIAYDAPAGCPAGVEIQRRFEEHLRSAPASAALPAIDARVQIRSGFEAEIVLIDEGVETRRALTDPSCTVLADAAVLIVALAFVPELSVSADAAAAPVASPPAEDPRLFGGALWLAAHGSIGALPGVVVGGELGGAVRLDALSVELAVRGVPLVDARFGVAPGAGGDIALALGLLRVLGVLTLDPRFELRGGGGIECGVALGRGVGITDPREAAGPWVAIEGAIGAAWVPWAVVALFLEAEAIVPVVRPVFSIAGLGTLYRPEPVAGGLRLGLELRFP